jgi:hypothetical protein
MIHHPRYIPFGQLPRHRQKDAYIRIKNRIRRAAPILGGRFYTHDVLHSQNGWIDFYFLGQRAPLFYNATLETTFESYKEAVWERAWEASYELTADDEPDWLASTVKDPRTGYYVTPARDPKHYPALAGLSRLKWVERQLPAIADSGEVQVFAGWTLHHDYRHGIGLSATVEAPAITSDVVHAFIAQFLVNPTDWRDWTPRSYRYVVFPEGILRSRTPISDLGTTP